MTTIHYAYCFATLAFGTVAMFITNDTSLSFNGPSDDFFLYLVPFIAIGGTLVGHFIFNTNLKEVQQKPSLQEKLSGYQSARLIRLALIEGPSLFAVVGFIITNNQLYLIIAFLLLTYMIFLRPTPQKIKQDLNLTIQERKELREALK